MSAGTLSFSVSCPSGGTFYVCSKSAQRFLGCCTVDACERGGVCPHNRLKPTSFKAERTGWIPKQGCASGQYEWHICARTAPPFMGCFLEGTNPCDNMDCPYWAMGQAVLSNNQSEAAAFLTSLLKLHPEHDIRPSQSSESSDALVAVVESPSVPAVTTTTVVATRCTSRRGELSRTNIMSADTLNQMAQETVDILELRHASLAAPATTVPEMADGSASKPTSEHNISEGARPILSAGAVAGLASAASVSGLVFLTAVVSLILHLYKRRRALARQSCNSTYNLSSLYTDSKSQYLSSSGPSSADPQHADFQYAHNIKPHPGSLAVNPAEMPADDPRRMPRQEMAAHEVIQPAELPGTSASRWEMGPTSSRWTIFETNTGVFEDTDQKLFTVRKLN